LVREGNRVLPARAIEEGCRFLRPELAQAPQGLAS
jgi:hypothetical protein